MKVMKTLVKKAALLVIALALAVSAPGCVADPEAQADRRKPAKADTAYYQHKAGDSYSQIQWAPVGKPPNWEEP
jgi:hypothetical protein